MKQVPQSKYLRNHTKKRSYQQEFPDAKNINISVSIAKETTKELNSIMKWMPEVDINYLRGVLK